MASPIVGHIKATLSLTIGDGEPFSMATLSLPVAMTGSSGEAFSLAIDLKQVREGVRAIFDTAPAPKESNE